MKASAAHVASTSPPANAGVRTRARHLPDQRVRGAAAERSSSSIRGDAREHGLGAPRIEAAVGERDEVGFLGRRAWIGFGHRVSTSL